MNRKKKNSGGLKREDSIEEVEDEEQSQEQKDIDDYRLVKNEASLSNGSIGAKESKEPEKGVGKGKKKKKVKKEEQNEGIRIAREKKIEYLFRNICTPDGRICLQSLGRALAKHKIEFKVHQLKQMMTLCAPEAFKEQEQQMNTEQISEKQKSIGIKYQQFRHFYEDNF